MVLGRERGFNRLWHCCWMWVICQPTNDASLCCCNQLHATCSIITHAACLWFWLALRCASFAVVCSCLISPAITKRGNSTMACVSAVHAATLRSWAVRMDPWPPWAACQHQDQVRACCSTVTACTHLRGTPTSLMAGEANFCSICSSICSSIETPCYSTEECYVAVGCLACCARCLIVHHMCQCYIVVFVCNAQGSAILLVVAAISHYSHANFQALVFS